MSRTAVKTKPIVTLVSNRGALKFVVTLRKLSIRTNNESSEALRNLNQFCVLWSDLISRMSLFPDCSSLIIDKAQYNDFGKFANDHLIRSYEYLFLSAQFGTHLKDRPGFEKVLHGLSDNAWGKGIEMIKELTKRGAVHSFSNTNEGAIKPHGDLNEVESIAKAVEIEKSLLIRANDIHRHHSHATLNEDKVKGYDAGLAHYLEEEIIEGKIDTVRNLVGHVNDLKNIFKKDTSIFPMSLYLFDKYLQN